ncbi:hypothetical protein ACG7TL_005313 [Trametes sanguinea]
MDHDTQMVSILYRTHKGLSTSAKVWSLYAFDALARAARNRANKSRMTADLTSEKGNCATFLLRIEGILDGLFQDLISTGNDDVKEKAKKIVDIWTKSHTFSAAVLSPLYALLNQAGNDKESDRADTTNVASTEPASAPALPFSQPSTSTQPAATAPTVNVEAVQSTLFALLSKAASAVGSAPPPTPITSLSQCPIEMIITVHLSPIESQSMTGSTALNAVFPAMTTMNPVVASEAVLATSGAVGAGEASGATATTSETEVETSRATSDRDEAAHAARPVDTAVRDLGTPGHPGYGSGPRGRSPARPEDGKDEFGRDLRAESPRDSDSASVPSYQRRSTSPIPPGRGASSATASDRGSVASENTNRSRNYSPYQHTATGPSSYPHTYSSAPSAPAAISLSTASEPSASEQSHIHGAVGLDAFDLTTFNPGLAASWEALAAAWRVTHGSMPTQEQLMQFVFSKTPLPQPQPPGDNRKQSNSRPLQHISHRLMSRIRIAGTHPMGQHANGMDRHKARVRAGGEEAEAGAEAEAATVGRGEGREEGAVTSGVGAVEETSEEEASGVGVGIMDAATTEARIMREGESGRSRSQMR